MKNKNIMKYVPKRLKEAVRKAFSDSDGYWIFLKDGYIDTNMGTRVLHCETIQQLRDDLKNVERI